MEKGTEKPYGAPQVLRGVHAMTKRQEMVERRKHKRYEVPTGSFVVVGSHGPILGQIIDISMGGVAFRYMNSGKPKDESYLDIFLTEGDVSMGKVSFKSVSDFEISNVVLRKLVDPMPLSALSMKRSSVQFAPLTPDQISRLEDLIRKHTTGEV
jgi:hypothetical protein